MDEIKNDPVVNTDPQTIIPIIKTGTLQVTQGNVENSHPKKPHATYGNQFALKYNTPEKRKELLDAYCEHKKKGFSDASFVPCDMDTFNSYRERYPSEFPSDIIRSAKREGRLKWEAMGSDGTEGKPLTLGEGKDKKLIYKRFNPQSYQFMMQNMFGWKIRTDVTTNDKELPPPVLGGASIANVSKDDSNK